MSRDARKKKEQVEEVPVIIESPFLGEIRCRLQDTEKGENVAVEVMELVYEKACALMLSNYYDRTSIPYTVQAVSNEILDLIQFIFVDRDCENGTFIDAETWIPDEEPPSVVPDTLARGVLQTRRRPDVSDVTETRLNTSMTSSSRRSLRKKAREKPSDENTNRANVKKRETYTPTNTTRQKAVTKENLNENALKFVDLAVTTQAPLSTRLSSPRIKISREYAEAAANIRLEQERKVKKMELQESMEKITRELKNSGKEFTVDVNSYRVHTIHHLDAKSLPSQTVQMKVRVDGEPLDYVPPQAAKKASKSSIANIRNFVKPKSPKQKKTEQKIPPNTWLPFKDQQAVPMLDEVQPAAGVTLRDGDVIKKMDLKISKEKISKADFKRAMEAIGFSQDYLNVQESFQKQVELQLKVPKKESKVNEEKKKDIEVAAKVTEKGNTYQPQAIAPLAEYKEVSKEGIKVRSRYRSPIRTIVDAVHLPELNTNTSVNARYGTQIHNEELAKELIQKLQ